VHDVIIQWTLAAATLTEGFATLIIFAAALEAAVRSAIVFVRFRQDHQGIQQIRWRFGRWLSLALDFLIASDILRTGVSPSWTEIGQLGAIVAIRIVITIALSREVNEIAPSEKTTV
jgi:uncharacterized membrane protein